MSKKNSPAENAILKTQESGKDSLHLEPQDGDNPADLPSSLWTLTGLRTLRLSGWSLENLPKGIESLDRLEELNLSRNSIRYIEWSSLPSSLKTLNLRGNYLTSVSDLSHQLPLLRSLDIGVNRMNDTLTWLPSLPLEHLGLSGDWLDKTPGWLGQIPTLQSLDLSCQSFTSLDVDTLPNLKKLHWWIGNLSSIPPALRKSPLLEELTLAGHELTDIPEWIATFPHLRSLNLSGNNLPGLPDFFREMSQLQALSLGNNPFTEFPHTVLELRSLERLDLTQSDLFGMDLSEAELGSRLRKQVSDRKATFTSIPGGILRLDRLSELALNGLDLITPPPEILKTSDPNRFLRGNDLERVKSYFRQLISQGIDHLLEAKVLIVGEGGAGKTSLARKLLDADADLPDEDDSTRGIDVSSFSFPRDDRQFRVNIWDFGGQEIYHATHQFFLTKRSLYLLLADNRREDSNFGYWMNVIDLLSDGSPVVVVLNEKGDRHREIDEAGLRGRFPNLTRVCSTDLKSGRGLASLLGELQHQVVDLPHVGVALPAQWVEVREALEALTDDFVDVNVFYRVCDDCGFRDRGQQLELSGYLHDLGVFLHFQDDPVLRRIVILNSQWGTDAVYRILDDPSVVDAFGRFTREDMVRIWHEDRFLGMHSELVQLMVRFRLCYSVPGEPGVFLAPQLLPEGRPDLAPQGGDLVIVYRYKFMPKGLVLRLIVELNTLVEARRMWRRGCVLNRDNAVGQVEEDVLGQEIILTARGARARELLSNMTLALDQINAGFPRMTVEKLYPCLCSWCHSQAERHYFAYSDLSAALERSVKAIQCLKSFEMIPLAQIMDTIPLGDGNRVVESSDANTRTLPERASSVFNGPVGRVIVEEHRRPETRPSNDGPRPRSLWGNGAFLLLALVVVVACAVAVGVLVSPVLVPVVLVSAIVLFVVFGATSLRSGDLLSEGGALAWLGQGLSKLNLVRTERSER